MEIWDAGGCFYCWKRMRGLGRGLSTGNEAWSWWIADREGRAGKRSGMKGKGLKL